LPENASRGKNVLQALKKVSLTPMDQINQQTVAAYVQEAIWLGNKMLPKNWSKWRYDKKRSCQMILKKEASSVGVDGKLYWEEMLLGFTSNKFCYLRANFKQELFQQFQGKLFNI
jgi:hypothetical protein